MKNTAHFKKSEFFCKCCGKEKVNQHLLTMLELVRVHFGKPVHINSGYRCVEHNKAVGGSEKSQHLEGNAADIWIQGVAPIKLYQFLVQTFPEGYGFICYKRKGFVHIDVRPTTWRDIKQ